MRSSKHGWDAYGTSLGSAPSGPYGYGAQWGYYTDSETGLCALAYRAYDPATGRFLTRDPIGYAGGVNLYGYVGNGPAGAVDPEGLLPLPVVTAGVGAIAGGIWGGFNAWRRGENVWLGMGKGAVIGGIAGLAGGFGVVGIGRLAGGGAVGGMLTGGFGGLTGDAAGQSAELLFGWRDRYSLGQTACSVLIGGGLGGGYGAGREIRFGPNFRIAPFGNRTGHPLGRWPHYHRRGLDGQGGTLKGQGIGRHRPWETKSDDKAWRDRF